MPSVAPVQGSCLAQLHTELVCHVVRRHSGPSPPPPAPLVLGDGTLAAPSGSDGAFPQLLQLGRSVGLRVAERFFFLGDDLPRPRDHDAAVLALERFWRTADLGRAQFDSRPTQREGETSVTQLAIVDPTFLFTRHVLRAPAPTDLSDDGATKSTAAGSVNSGAFASAASAAAAAAKPTADDYLTYTQGLLCGFLETLGFVAVQAGSTHRRAALAAGKPVVEVMAEVQHARRAAVFQVLFTTPLK
jgi:hypothetical protein